MLCNHDFGFVVSCKFFSLRLVFFSISIKAVADSLDEVWNAAMLDIGPLQVRGPDQPVRLDSCLSSCSIDRPRFIIVRLSWKKCKLRHMQQPVFWLVSATTKNCRLEHKDGLHGEGHYRSLSHANFVYELHEQWVSWYDFCRAFFACGCWLFCATIVDSRLWKNWAQCLYCFVLMT